MSVQLSINELKELASVLTQKTGYPFNDFPASFLKRRLTHYFERFHIRRIDQLIEQCGSKLFLESLLYHFSVETTEMFRDPGFWRAFNSTIQKNSFLLDYPVWFPDAASGEEIFSFQILASLAKFTRIPQVYYHHPSSTRLEEIKAGILKSKDVELNSNNLKRLELDGDFDRIGCLVNNTMRIHGIYLQKMTPQKGWFLTPPPEAGNVGMIIFRNMMLYMNKPLQEKVCQNFLERLIPGGLLAIGIKESLPDIVSGKFECVDAQERIFRKPIVPNGM